jgi:hypothetical protein
MRFTTLLLVRGATVADIPTGERGVRSVLLHLLRDFSQ